MSSVWTTLTRRDWRDVIETTIQHRKRHGFVYRDEAAMRNELEAFFYRTDDEARWFPIDRAEEIFQKYEES